ncbi:S1C family serine protease [Thermophilibacter sp. ZX-H3]|uniref:S1C family serine protease n=1 Tax=unclassified Thermophilibacter TaxID=2847308 RepID=UPI004040B37C
MSDYPYGAQTPQNPQTPQSPYQQPADQQPTQAQPTQQRPPFPGAHSAQGASSQGAQYQAQPGQTQRQTPPQPEPSAPQPPAAPEFGAEKRQRPGLRAVLAGLLGGVLGAAALTGVLVGTGVVGTGGGTASTGTSQSITIDPSDEDTTVANAVAAKTLPSVVTVYSTYANGEGMGSGVIYDTNGNVITNNHVIEDAESISVTLNGQSYDATLVGTDASSDLAVLHVDFGDTEVTPMEIGDSSELQVGDWVMSVGSPFGLENSVSQGIVSALSRSTLMEGASGNTLYTNLIQTDATINPGNSGGALVNAEGQLVGICTLYSSDTQSFAGIGYAIPSDYATEVADKIIAGETVTHAYIGLSMQTVNAQNAFRNNLAVNQGAYVVEVAAGGPAEAAGIQEGDVITKIGDDAISSADAAILAVRSHSIGETVKVTVMRGSEELTLDVTLGSDESLQQEQEEQGDQTVNVNGQEVTIDDLIDLYQQYQQEQQMSPFGGR